MFLGLNWIWWLVIGGVAWFVLNGTTLLG